MSVRSLSNAIFAAIQTIRDDVHTWGLTSLGVDRVLHIVSQMEIATIADIRLFEKTGCSIDDTLRARLHNLRDLKTSVIDLIQDALNAGWVGKWHEDIEANPVTEMSGISVVLAGRPARMKN